MSVLDARERKRELRSQFRKRREAVPAEQRQANAAAAAQQAMSWLAGVGGVEPGGAVGVYLSIGHELDTEPLIGQLRAAGVSLAAPGFDQAGVMSFAVWEDDTTLVAGKFKVLEPGIGALAISSDQLAAVFMPAVAVTRGGDRLGQGGGHYDRYLAASAGRLVTAAVVYDEQVAEALPVEDHDCPVDAVITPSRVYRLGR